MSTTIPSGTDSEATPGELDAFAQNFFGFDSLEALTEYVRGPPVFGKFACIVKDRADGSKKRRLIGLEQSKALISR